MWPRDALIRKISINVDHKLNQPYQGENNQLELKRRETGRNEEMLSDLRGFVGFVGWDHKVILQDKGRRTPEAIQRSLNLPTQFQKGVPLPGFQQVR